MDDAAILREIARRIREGMDKSEAGAPSAPVSVAQMNDDDHLTRRLAHELKTPLSAIVSAAEIMTSQSLGPMHNAQYLGYASDIAASGRHALAIVERILEQRPETGELAEAPFDFTELDVNLIVDRTASVLRPLANQRGQSIDTELADGLPHLIADATSLRQILLNLMTNAIKYADADSTITIATRYQLDGPLTLEVRDTGPGIDAERLAALSESSAPLKTKGHGLGLPLVRRLAEANGAVFTLTAKGATVATLTFGKDRVVPV